MSEEVRRAWSKEEEVSSLVRFVEYPVPFHRDLSGRFRDEGGSTREPSPNSNGLALKPQK